MPLSVANEGTINIIRKVGGQSETRKFLETLGFVTGSEVVVVSKNNGNIIRGLNMMWNLRGSSMRMRVMRLRLRMRLSVLGFASNRNREPNNSASNSPTFTTRYSYLTNKCITIKQMIYEQQDNWKRHCQSHPA